MESVQKRPMTELERLRLQANQATDESLESTRRMVQMCEESKQTGASTMEQLASQGEKLRHVNRDMDVIHEEVKKAEEDLEYLNRCCGLCVPPWNKRKKLKSPNVFAASRAASAQNSIKLPKSTQPVANEIPIPGQGHFITRITNDEREDEMETNLQQVSGMVGDLRMMATEMNQEIRTHNEILTQIDDKATANQERIARAQQSAERIVGKAAEPKSELPKTNTLGLSAAKFMMS